MTKCAAFWKHTNIRSGDRIFPCCRFKTPVDTYTGTVDNILTSDAYELLRSKSLSGEKIEGCSKCYYEESLGKKSLREKFNEQYSTDSVRLEYLEIGFDNICNLTCDGCWGEFSSAWANKENPNDVKKINIVSSKPILDIPDSVNEILFLGGEPLMTNRHQRLLERLPDRSKVSVTYNTNGTFLLSQLDIELMKQLKHVSFIVSIDGYADLNDKVRSGSKWNEIMVFIDQLKKEQFDFSIHTTIHLNNYTGLAALSAWINEFNYQWTTNILTYPAHLDIKNLDNNEKMKLRTLLETDKIPNSKYILEHIR
jgi:sulfatase maturation enzyme AslB (radical SAM superfamily)